MPVELDVGDSLGILSQPDRPRFDEVASLDDAGKARVEAVVAGLDDHGEPVAVGEPGELVIAGAGTGKTKTLIYRVAYLVELGCNPQSILLLTVTRKAASEMLKRVMSGCVMGSTPVLRCCKKNGTTEPRDPITLP